MFKHILLPIDGSAMSDMASQKCIALAKESGAQVIGIYVIPDFHVFSYAPEVMTDTSEQYQKDSQAYAKQILAKVQGAANEVGVACTTLSMVNDHPYDAIVKAAKDKGCDLICMASHGRKGVKGLLLGSETQKVLTHTDIPVLVYR
jgi:nucleotide-binding universal stress UspA family protein